jgi:hypothetical protein
MTTTNQPPSNLRIVLMWLLVVGLIVFWVVFWLWRNHVNAPPPDGSAEQPGGLALHSIISLFVGGFFLMAGGTAYALAGLEWTGSGERC